MNNPDEETAVAQFGKGDKYFGICTLLVTMPGLPMFGHGQIEGFEDKYGMEYRRSYRDEVPDGYMVDRHEREIFPLMKRRYLFSGSAGFRLYDLYCDGGSVNENVFAYSNSVRFGGYIERSLIFYNNSYYETSGWIKVSDPAIPCEGGTRRDNLSEALSIHGESQYFTLLREQKSNLWFIRSSKSICESGFYVHLSGYETQVYLDIYEVEDDHKGRWARLNNDTQGRGVSDPLAAIKDIFLGELYYQLLLFFRAEVLDNLVDLDDLSLFMTELRELANDYIITASLFIVGGNGAYDEWIPPDASAPEDGKKVTRKFSPVPDDEILDEFEDFANRAKTFIEEVKKHRDSGGGKSLFFAEIMKRVKNEKLLCAVTVGYGLISLLRSIIGREADGTHAAHLAFTHRDLGRKLREVFCKLGATDKEAWRIIDIARVVLGKTKIDFFPETETKFDAAKFAALIIEKNYSDEDFRRILGINIFDDVAWFNKEGFEDALFYSSLFFMVDRSIDIPAKERIERVTNIYEVLAKAVDKSGYRFDNLFDGLTSKPRAGKAKAAKPSEPPQKSKDSKAGEVKKVSKAKPAAPAKKTPVKKTPAAKTSKEKTSKEKASKDKTVKEKSSKVKPKKEEKKAKPKGKKK
jgi:hypothetical protein